MPTLLPRFAAFFVCLFLAYGATAQVYPGVSTSGNEDANQAIDAANSDPNTALSEALINAAEGGAKVIIINPDGTTGLVAEQDQIDRYSEENMSGLMGAQTEATKFREKLIEKLNELPNAWVQMDYIMRSNSPDGTLWVYFEVLYWSLGLFFIGSLFQEYIYGRLLAARWVIPMIKKDPVGYSGKLPFLVVRALSGVLGNIISMVVAYTLGSILFPGKPAESIQFTIAIVYLTYFLCRLVAVVWRMVLSPFLSQYRIPAFSDKDALRLYHWLWITAALNLMAVFFSVWMWELGLTYGVYALYAATATGVMVLLNIVLVLVNRRAISGAIRNGKDIADVSAPTRIASNIWAPLAIFYFIFAWGDIVYRLVLEKDLSKPLILGAYSIILTILVVYGIVSYVIERFFQRSRYQRELNNQIRAAESAEALAQAEPMAMQLANAEVGDMDGDGDEEGGMLAQAPDEAPVLVRQKHALATYEDLARRVAAVMAFVAGIYAVLIIWNLEQGIMSDSIIDQTLDVVIILFMGYIAYHFVRIWIDQKIDDEGGEEVEAAPGDEGGAGGASRLATLLPLFRNFMLAVIFVTVFLIILLQIGINVSPLFAGAGVVGLAIGFGSQALVRDVFSGAFFLFDDAFRKGEYIDIGTVKGTVEKISVRSFQLRHHLGPLHTIPFGEIQFLTNYSRDWVMMKLPLRVTYDTDVDKVRKLIKKLGQDLMEDPVIGENFIQPLKSQGVIEMQDSAMIIRVKFMTKPGDQWVIRKRVFQDIRDLFEREGIKFAHREVTVRLAGGENPDTLSLEDKEKVAGAAHAAMLAAEEEEAGAPPKGGDDR